jgi:hypothetical protein
MELKREDDVILILTEFTDEALGLAELGRKETGNKVCHRRTDSRKGTRDSPAYRKENRDGFSKRAKPGPELGNVR